MYESQRKNSIIFFLRKWAEKFFRGSFFSKNKATHQKKETGDWGEKLALESLQRKGYRLVAKNWRSGRGEIDLIMLDRESLVFLEVRVRNEFARTNAYFSVNATKKKVLRKVCKAYLYQLKDKPPFIRFDIYAITMKTNHHPIQQHYQNIPLFGKDFHFN